MVIKVWLGIFLANCAQNHPDKQPTTHMHLEKPVSVDEIIDLLGIPRAYIGFSTINGERVDFNNTVCDGDELIFFPYVTGG